MRTTIAEVVLAAVMLAPTALNHVCRHRERRARRRSLDGVSNVERLRDR